MKMKEFGPPGGGARPWRPPLDPPMISMKQDITDYTVLSNCNMKVYLVLENLFFIIKVVDS